MVARSVTKSAVCAGLYSSGSTWLFNVVLQLLNRKALPLYADDDQPQLSEHDFVLKTHKPNAALRGVIDGAPTMPLFVSIRDPRDAVVSLMQRFNTPFSDALSLVSSSAEMLTLLRNDRISLLLKYEDGFTASSRTVMCIAERLGVSPSSAEIAAIMLSHSADGVRRQIQAWVDTGLFATRPAGFKYEPETHWHPNHVGDGRCGKWPELLTPDQSKAVAMATSEFCRRFDYRHPASTQ